MEDKKTGTKEAVEVRGSRAEARPDDKKTVELSRTYEFEGDI